MLYTNVIRYGITHIHSIIFIFILSTHVQLFVQNLPFFITFCSKPSVLQYLYNIRSLIISSIYVIWSLNQRVVLLNDKTRYNFLQVYVDQFKPL